MPSFRRFPRLLVWILLSGVSFTIAFLALGGVILSRDATGRLIYGILWSLVGLGWLARYIIPRRKLKTTDMLAHH